MRREKKVPTLFALFFLIAALFAGVFLIQKRQVFFLRATPEITPNQVKITNVTDSSFNISWLTEKETSGFIRFGETEALGQTFADDRDQIAGSTGSFQTHYVSLRNLKPKTNYFFKIGSGGVIFDNSGKPYEVATATTLSGVLPPSDVASGTVLRLDGTPAEGAILYLNLPNVTPQSTLIRSSGAWVISLNSALSASLSTYASYDKEAQVEEIFVQGGSLGMATATTTTKNDNPVGEIILGKTHDFRQTLPPTEEETSSPPSSKFSFTELPQPKQATESVELKILSPTQNEKLATQKPEIFGTGPAGKTLQIVIESPVTTTTVKTDSQGNWRFTPPANLAPGSHTVKISLADKTVSRAFTVLASGSTETPAFTATPSATLTPTRSPTPTPTLPPRTLMPATAGGVPQSGNLTPTFLVFIVGLILVFIGFTASKLAHAR